LYLANDPTLGFDNEPSDECPLDCVEICFLSASNSFLTLDRDLSRLFPVLGGGSRLISIFVTFCAAADICLEVLGERSVERFDSRLCMLGAPFEGPDSVDDSDSEEAEAPIPVIVALEPSPFAEFKFDCASLELALVCPSFLPNTFHFEGFLTTVERGRGDVLVGIGGRGVDTRAGRGGTGGGGPAGIPNTATAPDLDVGVIGGGGLGNAGKVSDFGVFLFLLTSLARTCNTCAASDSLSTGCSV
jgi:hypothetical protein